MAHKHSPNRAKHIHLGGNDVIKIGGHSTDWGDTYHFVLKLSWPRFMLLVVGFYLLINLLFGLAYFAVPGCINNVRPGVYSDAFFFSIETLATVGYGNMNPQTLYGHIVSSIEILLGMMSIAIMTGLMFARFAKPTARVQFSKVAVIHAFNGVPTLMFRAANQRNNLMYEASVRVTLVRRETSEEGAVFRRFYNVELERDRSSAFALSWTIMHKIDESSPLFGKTQAQLSNEHSTLTVSLQGTDETLNASVHARHEYSAEDLRFDHQFIDMLSDTEKQFTIDFRNFHLTKPIATIHNKN